MKTNEFKEEISNLDSSTVIYDAFDPIIKRKVKEPRTFQKILALTKNFMSKNEFALSTNIVGRRIIVNEKMESDIYDIFDIDKNELIKVMSDSPFLSHVKDASQSGKF